MKTTSRDHLTRADTIAVAAIGAEVPTLVEARDAIDSFHRMIRRKMKEDFKPWLQAARWTLVASFANRIAEDEAVVCAAITSPWSNGQTTWRHSLEFGF